jgi:hypothetical protein
MWSSGPALILPISYYLLTSVISRYKLNLVVLSYNFLITPGGIDLICLLLS